MGRHLSAVPGRHDALMRGVAGQSMWITSDDNAGAAFSRREWEA
ncbi:hypothetical protein [Sphingomonas sp. GB1N7]